MVSTMAALPQQKSHISLQFPHLFVLIHVSYYLVQRQRPGRPDIAHPTQIQP